MTSKEQETFKKEIIADIKTLLVPIIEKLNNIEEKVESMWKYNNMESYKEFPPVMYSQSPIQLNDFGNKILNNYKGKEVVDSTKAILFAEIDKAGCKSPLDVQVMAERIIQYSFHTDPFLKVRNILYENPMFEGQRINPKILFTIMGIYLRNLYLAKNKNLLKGISELKLIKQ